jgi:hypothetical protein
MDDLGCQLSNYENKSSEGQLFQLSMVIFARRRGAQFAFCTWRPFGPSAGTQDFFLSAGTDFCIGRRREKDKEREEKENRIKQSKKKKKQKKRRTSENGLNRLRRKKIEPSSGVWA